MTNVVERKEFKKSGKSEPGDVVRKFWDFEKNRYRLDELTEGRIFLFDERKLISVPLKK
jgi:hypothetical protein